MNLLEKTNDENYSDNNVTLTTLDATLRYGTGDPIEGAELSISISNESSDVAAGTIDM
mgnify:CR=1 FL=1